MGDARSGPERPDVVAGAVAIGAVERDGDTLRPTRDGAASLSFLAEQTRGLVEGYHAVLSAVGEIEGDIGHKDLAKAIEGHVRRLQLVGELRRPEAYNPVGLAPMLALLERRGWLQRVRGEGREKRYAPGPEAGELPALQAKLAGALASG